MNTLVVNFLGGPGIGKSTTSTGVFSKLKMLDVNCELATEYAKDLVWGERYVTFNDQIYLFAKQYHKLFNLIGKVDVIINDSSLLLTPIYDKEERKSLKQLVFDEYYKMNNLNILLKREKKFVQTGRINDEEESKGIDIKIKNLLLENNFQFLETNNIDDIVSEIRYRL